MIKELIFPFLLLLTSLAYAQDESLKSKIKFKDGSELHAVIKEDVPTQHVIIMLPNNEESTINYDNILTIKHKDFNYYSKYTQPKGFYIEGFSSLLFGRETENSDSRIGLSIGVSANYRLNSYLSAGIGIEPTAFNSSNTPIPIYAHLKSNLMERKTAPVFIFDLGWLLPSTKTDIFSTQGGWFARPALGIQTKKFTLSMGYQLQKITTTHQNRRWWWGAENLVIVEERLMRNITLMTSFRF